MTKITFSNMVCFLMLFTAFINKIHAQDLTDPVLSYYFDNSIVNYGNAGVNGDLTASAGAAVYATGKSGTAGDYSVDDFRATDYYLQTVEGSGWPYGTTLGGAARTISAWIKINSGSTGDQGVFCVGAEAQGGGFFIKVLGNGQIRVDLGTNYYFDSGAAGAVPQGTWTHIAVTSKQDGTVDDIKVYVNGVDVTGTNIHSAVTGTVVNTWIRPVFIGIERHYSGGYINRNFFDGQIDALKYFDFEATSSDVNTLMGQTTLPVKEFETNEISVYPTNVSDYLNIKSAEFNEFDVMVYDVSGKVVKRVSVLDNKLDMSALSSGLYILKIRSGGKMSTFKIVKK